MLICYYACSLIYLERLFCCAYQIYMDLQHGGVRVLWWPWMQNLVTSLHLICYWKNHYPQDYSELCACVGTYTVVPPVIRPPLSTRVTEGDTASFHCSFTGTPFPYTRIGWLSKQQPINVSLVQYMCNKLRTFGYFDSMYAFAIFVNSENTWLLLSCIIWSSDLCTSGEFRDW